MWKGLLLLFFSSSSKVCELNKILGLCHWQKYARNGLTVVKSGKWNIALAIPITCANTHKHIHICQMFCINLNCYTLLRAAKVTNKRKPPPSPNPTRHTQYTLLYSVRNTRLYSFVLVFFPALFLSLSLSLFLSPTHSFAYEKSFAYCMA